MNSRKRLIKRYEQIIEEEVFSDDKKGISMPVLYSMVRALKEGRSPEDIEYDRDCNQQHMDQAYFRKIRWTWDRAIRAARKDESHREKEGEELTQCIHCGAWIKPSYGKDSPSEHADHEGTHEDPRAPGDYNNICDVCNYSLGLRGGVS